jgi:hypothetical protein
MKPLTPKVQECGRKNCINGKRPPGRSRCKWYNIEKDLRM